MLDTAAKRITDYNFISTYGSNAWKMIGAEYQITIGNEIKQQQ